MVFPIEAKYAPEIFCPSNAIDEYFWNHELGVDPYFKTLDGKVCKPTFIRTTNNRGGVYDEEFDYFCNKHFGMSFASIRSMWFARLGRLDDYWHYIKLD